MDSRAISNGHYFYKVTLESRLFSKLEFKENLLKKTTTRVCAIHSVEICVIPKNECYPYHTDFMKPLVVVATAHLSSVSYDLDMRSYCFTCFIKPLVSDFCG